VGASITFRLCLEGQEMAVGVDSGRLHVQAHIDTQQLVKALCEAFTDIQELQDIISTLTNRQDSGIEIKYYDDVDK
jgi:hypothetical protein